MVYKDEVSLNERGNVLFLVLIAVALFAALSYAVTKSTRTDSVAAHKERTLVSSASMTQYPTALKTSVIRMLLGGADISEIAFDAPDNFNSISNASANVFHQNGGDAVYQPAEANLMAGNSEGVWFFNANWNVPEIGIDGAGGNELIAFLPGINSNVCLQTNAELSIATTGCTMSDGNIPDLDPAQDHTLIRDNQIEGDVFPNGGDNIIQGEGCSAFSGQHSGCFWSSDNGGEYVYYSILFSKDK